MSLEGDDKALTRDSQAENSPNWGFQQRLIARMNEIKIEQSQLVKLSGINKNSISAYRLGTRMASIDLIFPLAKALQVRPEWLILGTGPKLESVNISARDLGFQDSSNLAFGGALKSIPQIGEMPDWRISIPVVDLQVATGLDHELDRIIEDFVIDPSVLAMIGNDRLKDLAVGDMPTDVLAPRIPEGSRLIIDTNDCILREGIFVFKYGQNLQVKKLRPVGIDGVELISENPLYSPQVVDGENLKHLKILGRIVAAIAKV